MSSKEGRDIDSAAAHSPTRDGAARDPADPVTDGDAAYHWRHPGLGGVDLMRARFVSHAFGRHSHETYTIGVIEDGLEEIRHPGGRSLVGPNAVVVFNPEVVHTGRSAVAGGFRYRVLYPAVEVVRESVGELRTRRGLPVFAGPVIDDGTAARLILRAHLAAENLDSLSADLLLRTAIAWLLRAHAGEPTRAVQRTCPEAVGRARDILHASFAAPPSLGHLAAAVGSTPFSLHHGFRDMYGLPPHAYVTQLRVRRARALLDEGHPPALVAAQVGFVDQPHLTRHFRRMVGVPPGAYQRARKNVQETAGGRPYRR